MDQFARIPATTLPHGIVPEFVVGIYLCSKGPDGRAVVTAEGLPWTRITYRQAIEACRASGYELLTESQWLALAWRVYRGSGNWSSYDAPPQRRVLQGIRKGRVKLPVPGLHNPEHMHEHRWLNVHNDTNLCDLNGNAMQWVFDDIQGDREGLNRGMFSDSPSLITQPFKSHSHGMGWSPTHGAMPKGDHALCRGGSFLSGKDAGIYGLQIAFSHGEYQSVGFRCTRPLP